MPTFSAADGTELYFEDEGAGPPLVMLAGLTRSTRDFDFLAPHLGGLRLIAMDYRGRGRSAHADPASYTIPQEAQDVLALLDHLGLERAAVLGTSRGGLIAMTLAALAKDRLTAVALNDIGPVIEEAGLEAIRQYIGRVPAVRTHAEVAAIRSGLPGFSGVPEARWMEEAERLFEQTDDGLALRYDPRLAEPVLAGATQPQPDLWPLFDRLEGLPLALIRGEGSNILSKGTADEMARRRPDMIRAEVPGRGHVPFLDEPESLAALTEWIRMWR